MNTEAVADIMELLERLYPKWKLEPENIGAYALILHDIPADLLRAAALQVASQSREFPPSAGTIRTAAFELAERANGVPSAYEAWQQVKSNLDGRYAMHPLALKAINALGGLRAFGMSEMDDEPSWRARFISAYESYLRRAQDDARMLPEVREVVGQLAASNPAARVSAGISQVASRLVAGNGKAN